MDIVISTLDVHMIIPNFKQHQQGMKKISGRTQKGLLNKQNNSLQRNRSGFFGQGVKSSSSESFLRDLGKWLLFFDAEALWSRVNMGS